MARPLSANRDGKYTAAQVLAQMQSGNGIATGRFEVLDTNMNVVGNLDGVTAASVSVDRTRPVPGVLKLSLIPYSVPGVQPAWNLDALRFAPFQYYIKPWAQFGPMPDGGLAEFPMGVYVWMRPSRTIEGTAAAPWPGAEMWQIDCPDLTYLVNNDGPGDPAFTMSGGTPVGDCIGQVLNQAGFFDLSGISWSDLPLPTTMTFFFWQTFSDIFTATQTTGSPENWLTIWASLNTLTGFSAPWFNMDGVPQSKINPQLDIAEPDVVYDTADSSVTLLPVTSKPVADLICNRLFATSNVAGGQQVTALIDLNDLVPTHPLAQVNLHRYISVPYTAPADIATYEQLYAAGAVELARRLSMWETYTLTTTGFLALHEIDELVAVRVSNDPELSSTVQATFGGVPIPPDSPFITPAQWQYHAFLEQAWTYDFFGGEMQHTLGRFWRTF